MHRFKELEIWKKSCIFCKDIYKVTADFPDVEKFGLVNQLRRASISVPSNIAEGASRESSKEFSRFSEIANGSCYEIETQLLISNDLDFIGTKKLERLQAELESIIKMISKFRSIIKSRI